MYIVYSLQSEINPLKFYIGVTEDLDRRLSEHKSGQCSFTSEYRPWRLAFFIGLSDKKKAWLLEKYLKGGSGRAFSKKHF